MCGNSWLSTNPVFGRSIVAAHKPHLKYWALSGHYTFKRDTNKQRHIHWENDQKREEIGNHVLPGVFVQTGEMSPSH